jgi:hypothetical protein
MEPDMSDELRLQPVSTNQGEPMKKEEVEAEELGTFDAVVRAVDSLESEPSRHLSIQIDESIRDAILAAQASNQKASVTIQVKVTPGVERRVSFVATVKAQLPRPPVSGVTLYADAEGNVHNADPAQQRLAFYDQAAQPKKEN